MVLILQGLAALFQAHAEVTARTQGDIGETRQQQGFCLGKRIVQRRIDRLLDQALRMLRAVADGEQAGRTDGFATRGQGDGVEVARQAPAAAVTPLRSPGRGRAGPPWCGGRRPDGCPS